MIDIGDIEISFDLARSLPPIEATPDADRVDALFRERYDRIARRTDRIFAVLMVLQWVAAVGVSLWLSPRTWAGTESALHMHVYAALILGGMISSLPVALVVWRPGTSETRLVIAVAQVCWSALLIHLTGGRIETHFHIFGSLAILAFYRDARVLVPATIVVAADHFLRGLYWPESIYGVANPEWWRFLEHAGWVLFTVVFLVMNCVQSRRELMDICRQQVTIEIQKESQIQAARIAGEQEARARMEIAKGEAAREAYRELSQAHEQLRTMQRQLVAASRQAGIAELATDVLHNVGNALTSVNVSMDVVSARVSGLRTESLDKLAGLLEDHGADLARFVTDDPRGARLVPMVRALATNIGRERDEAMSEIANLGRHVDHIKAIVRSQQQAAKVGGATEEVELASVLDAAVELQRDSLAKQGIEVVRDCAEVPPVWTDRHRLVQIVANLVSNARQALRDAGRAKGTITFRLAAREDTVRLSVSDDGPGVPVELAEQIFQHGFTTKADGHGFGLHGSANMATELGGRLFLEPPLPGHGATFHLELPRRPAAAAA